MFGKTLGYYVFTSFFAVLTGLVLVNLIQPGVGADLVDAETKEMPDVTVVSSPVELILDIVPENLVAASAEAKMLSIILFAILLGVSIASLPRRHREPLVGIVGAAFQAMMRLTSGIIRWVAPIGVFSLILTLVGTTGLGSFKALGLYALVLIIGLSFHLFLTLPLILRLVGGINPIIHFRNMVEPMVMAFSTSSSGATLPVTHQVGAEESRRLQPRHFVRAAHGRHRQHGRHGPLRVRRGPVHRPGHGCHHGFRAADPGCGDGFCWPPSAPRLSPPPAWW